ncbi:MAG TPA: monovalent cation/H+ antiporter subunit D, partial [Burkholderiaceae bacterium]|nr:monovalent cation/H+ antiporter subunit D [Burkholderiaceae bacterium]
LSLLSTLLLLGVAATMVARAADGWTSVYLMSNWAAPYGIVLVADRLSTLMVLATSVLALVSLVAATGSWDERGPNFHALFQIQLMGLNGAFLTGDVFNLFVFFEVMLIASYGLLLHGGGGPRIGSGLRFVTINLTGAALFLIAVGLLYGVTGTLNMADLGLRLRELDPTGRALAQSGALLLLLVFILKSAVLPLYFWLPQTYPVAAGPVAALFAIMTKVGIYSLLRVSSVSFGGADGLLPPAVFLLLTIGGGATYLLAMIGTLASRDLRTLIAYLVVSSAAFLLTAAGIGTEASLAAAIYYLMHSTFAAAALFLIAEQIAIARGKERDRLHAGVAVAQPALLGGLFFVGATATASLPPFGGFIGKAMLLAAAVPLERGGWLFAALLLGSLLAIVALSRAGSQIFWKARRVDGEGAATAGAPPARIAATGWAPAVLALAVVAAIAVAAAPLQRYAVATAAALLQPAPLIERTLSVVPRPGPHSEPDR